MFNLLWGYENMVPTPNTSFARSNPAWQSLRRVFISLLRNSCLILLPSSCASINVYILCRVLQRNLVRSSVHSINTIYFMNFPMLSSIEGGRDLAVSDFICILIIAYKTRWILSMSWAHLFLFCFTFYDIRWAVRLSHRLKLLPAG
jgi:hypothetical protein